jgi:hypothetical protein
MRAMIAASMFTSLLVTVGLPACVLKTGGRTPLSVSQGSGGNSQPAPANTQRTVDPEAYHAKWIAESVGAPEFNQLYGKSETDAKRLLASWGMHRIEIDLNGAYPKCGFDVVCAINDYTTWPIEDENRLHRERGEVILYFNRRINVTMPD